MCTSVYYATMHPDLERQLQGRGHSDTDDGILRITLNAKDAIRRKIDRTTLEYISMAQELHQIAGIDLIDEPVVHIYRDCARYAFNKMMRERWKISFDAESPRKGSFWWNPHSYLLQHGYAPINDPQEGDIVVYGRKLLQTPSHEKEEWLHFGVLVNINDLRVQSKWGAYQIFRHDLPDTLNSYGNQIIFLRKSSKTSPS